MEYTRVVGTKFYEDGSVRQFPGNTIICFCEPNSNTYALLDWAQQQLRQQPFADKITLLPMPSMHMTVMQLLCIDHRVTEEWSKDLSLQATVYEADQFFIETVAQVTPPENFRMAYKELAVSDVGLGFGVEPANDATHEAIWAFRNAIAEATGIRFPNHDDYKFHISLGYIIVPLDEQEQQAMNAFKQQVDAHMAQHFGIYDSGPPHLTFFDDMFAFVPADQRHTLPSRSKA